MDWKPYWVARWMLPRTAPGGRHLVRRSRSRGDRGCRRGLAASGRPPSRQQPVPTPSRLCRTRHRDPGREPHDARPFTADRRSPVARSLSVDLRRTPTAGRDRAGWTEIPAQVRDVSDRQMAELAIVENLQRKDLNPLEKAVSFQQYLHQYRCTQEELAGRLGIDRSTIANLIRLLELPGGGDRRHAHGTTHGRPRPRPAAPSG